MARLAPLNGFWLRNRVSVTAMENWTNLLTGPTITLSPAKPDKLYFGDNLPVLKDYIANETISSTSTCPSTQARDRDA